jgi:hypothetical protein
MFRMVTLLFGVWPFEGIRLDSPQESDDCCYVEEVTPPLGRLAVGRDDKPYLNQVSVPKAAFCFGVAKATLIRSSVDGLFRKLVANIGVTGSSAFPVKSVCSS